VIRPFVDEIDRRYKAFGEQIKNALTIAIISTDESQIPNERLIRRLLNEADGAHAFGLKRVIDQAVQSMVSMSARSAFDRDESDSSVELIDYLQLTLADSYRLQLTELVFSQVKADMNFALRRYREFVLGVQIDRLRYEMTTEKAISQGKAGRTNFNFSKLDVSGRRWSSFQAINIGAKSVLTDLFNLTRVTVYESEGMETVVVDNPGGSNHGKTFALSEYPALKSKFFHPNSYAVVSLLITDR
jgi:hypothetical protein